MSWETLRCQSMMKVFTVGLAVMVVTTTATFLSSLSDEQIKYCGPIHEQQAMCAISADLKGADLKGCLKKLPDNLNGQPLCDSCDGLNPSPANKFDQLINKTECTGKFEMGLKGLNLTVLLESLSKDGTEFVWTFCKTRPTAPAPKSCSSGNKECEKYRARICSGEDSNTTLDQECFNSNPVDLQGVSTLTTSWLYKVHLDSYLPCRNCLLQFSVKLEGHNETHIMCVPLKIAEKKQETTMASLIARRQKAYQKMLQESLYNSPSTPSSVTSSPTLTVSPTEEQSPYIDTTTAGIEDDVEYFRPLSANLGDIRRPQPTVLTQLPGSGKESKGKLATVLENPSSLHVDYIARKEDFATKVNAHKSVSSKASTTSSLPEVTNSPQEDTSTSSVVDNVAVKEDSATKLNAYKPVLSKATTTSSLPEVTNSPQEESSTSSVQEEAYQKMLQESLYNSPSTPSSVTSSPTFTVSPTEEQSPYIDTTIAGIEDDVEYFRPLSANLGETWRPQPTVSTQLPGSGKESKGKLATVLENPSSLHVATTTSSLPEVTNTPQEGTSTSSVVDNVALKEDSATKLNVLSKATTTSSLPEVTNSPQEDTSTSSVVNNVALKEDPATKLNAHKTVLSKVTTTSSLPEVTNSPQEDTSTSSVQEEASKNSVSFFKKSTSQKNTSTLNTDAVSTHKESLNKEDTSSRDNSDKKIASLEITTIKESISKPATQMPNAENNLNEAEMEVSSAASLTFKELISAPPTSDTTAESSEDQQVMSKASTQRMSDAHIEATTQNVIRENTETNENKQESIETSAMPNYIRTIATITPDTAKDSTSNNDSRMSDANIEATTQTVIRENIETNENEQESIETSAMPNYIRTFAAVTLASDAAKDSTSNNDNSEAISHSVSGSKTKTASTTKNLQKSLFEKIANGFKPQTSSSDNSHGTTALKLGVTGAPQSSDQTVAMETKPEQPTKATLELGRKLSTSPTLADDVSSSIDMKETRQSTLMMTNPTPAISTLSTAMAHNGHPVTGQTPVIDRSSSSELGETRHLVGPMVGQTLTTDLEKTTTTTVASKTVPKSLTLSEKTLSVDVGEVWHLTIESTSSAPLVGKTVSVKLEKPKHFETVKTSTSQSPMVDQTLSADLEKTTTSTVAFKTAPFVGKTSVSSIEEGETTTTSTVASKTTPFVGKTSASSIDEGETTTTSTVASKTTLFVGKTSASSIEEGETTEPFKSVITKSVSELEDMTHSKTEDEVESGDDTEFGGDGEVSVNLEEPKHFPTVKTLTSQSPMVGQTSSTDLEKTAISTVASKTTPFVGKTSVSSIEEGETAEPLKSVSSKTTSELEDMTREVETGDYTEYGGDGEVQRELVHTGGPYGQTRNSLILNILKEASKEDNRSTDIKLNGSSWPAIEEDKTTTNQSQTESTTATNKISSNRLSQLSTTAATPGDSEQGKAIQSYYGEYVNSVFNKTVETPNKEFDTEKQDLKTNLQDPETNLQLQANKKVESEKQDLKTNLQDPETKLQLQANKKFDTEKQDLKTNLQDPETNLQLQANKKVETEKQDLKTNLQDPETNLQLQVNKKVETEKQDLKTNLQDPETNLQLQANKKVDTEKQDLKTNLQDPETKLQLQANKKVDTEKQDLKTNLQDPETKLQLQANKKFDTEKQDLKTNLQDPETKLQLQANKKVETEKQDLKTNLQDPETNLQPQDLDSKNQHSESKTQDTKAPFEDLNLNLWNREVSSNQDRPNKIIDSKPSQPNAKTLRKETPSSAYETTALTKSVADGNLKKSDDDVILKQLMKGLDFDVDDRLKFRIKTVDKDSEKSDPVSEKKEVTLKKITLFSSAATVWADCRSCVGLYVCLCVLVCLYLQP